MIALAVVLAASTAAAAPTLAALAPGVSDDARNAIAIGPGGEVYAPDGKGAWRHRAPSTTADLLTAAGRAGDAVVALGDGVVYRLADNGWSALRLHQHGKAILGAGPRALAAVDRQVFTLDTLTGGEPSKLVAAPGKVIALAAGSKAAIVVTDTATFRIDLPVGAGKPGKLAALPAAPRRVRVVSDRWAISERGAIELATGKLTRWPAGLAIAIAAATSDDALLAIAAGRASLELITVRGAAIARDPITGAAGGNAIGVVGDRAGRAAVAFADGRIAIRDQAGWTIAQVSDDAPAAHPGAGPATQ